MQCIARQVHRSHLQSRSHVYTSRATSTNLHRRLSVPYSRGCSRGAFVPLTEFGVHVQWPGHRRPSFPNITGPQTISKAEILVSASPRLFRRLTPSPRLLPRHPENILLAPHGINVVRPLLQSLLLCHTNVIRYARHLLDFTQSGEGADQIFRDHVGYVPRAQMCGSLNGVHSARVITFPFLMLCLFQRLPEGCPGYWRSNSEIRSTVAVVTLAARA